MKAIVQDRYGSADVLELQEVERPVPAAGEVLVRVRASSVNAADWHIMRGDPYFARLFLGLKGPKTRIRGMDFAGVVEETGPGAGGMVQVGDEVFGEVEGSFAEYVRVPANLVQHKPPNLTFEQAATLPLAGNTAWMGLKELRAGQQVLINGASGGVGLMAVQIAKARKAIVTGVCSTRNVEQVRSVGADHVVDYRTTDFTRSGQRYDLVFDLVGNRSMGELRALLTDYGTLVLSGGGSFTGGALFGPYRLIIQGKLLASFSRQRLVVLEAKPSKENLAALGELAESGQLVPIIERTYPLTDVADAIRHVESEHARAKVVVTA
ncbi:NADPH:quinone reductase [Lentzea albidocapillata subsp. violacea]|uniref:NADPH:quinone reductase n=1 Tax=Lentzea albidocapillata subsp. violacea TaxID=128104 RepID=A0A1G9XDZ9_9PSEU|nr:NAD(P)-dependent alcohol dehydrogenase [Lentzea albidocapillata]SDM94907.1 NADPH:quinone reductase [Lentzea albidocapillata subsp. violacea]